MLTKILLTHTIKLNIAFKLTLPIPIGLYSISGVSSLCLHGDATALASRTKDPPSYHAVRQNNASPKLFLWQCLPSPDLSYNLCDQYETRDQRGRSVAATTHRSDVIPRHCQSTVLCRLTSRGATACHIRLSHCAV